MRRFFTVLALIVGLGILGTAARAQQLPPYSVLQAPNRSDSASYNQTINGAVNATQAAGTVTVPAISTKSFYVTNINIQACQDATGAALANLAFTTTNLGGMAWQISSPLVTNGACIQVTPAHGVGFAPFVTAVGTAPVITPPAQTAHWAWNITISGYYAVPPVQ